MSTTAERSVALSHPGRGDFLTLQRAALFATAALAFASIAVSDVVPVWSLLAYAVAWLTGLRGRETLWRRYPWLPQALNYGSLAGLIALGAATLFGTLSLQSSAGMGTMMLGANRLLVRRRPQDDGLLHLSCWLMLAAGAALSGNLVYGLLLVLTTVVAAVSLTLAELRRGIEEEAPRQAHALLSAPEMTSPRLLSLAAVLGLFAVAFAVFLFPLFPRAQLGLMHELAFGGTPTTGVSESVDLNARGELQESSRLVARAMIEAGDPKVLDYWRVVTLDEFTGASWKLSGPGDRRALRLFALTGVVPTVRGSLEVLPSSDGLIPVPEGLTDLRPDVASTALHLGQSGDLRLLGDTNASFRFAASGRRFDASRVSSEMSHADELRYLQLPELAPEVTALAEKLIPEGTKPREAARLVSRYLQGFQYSREPYTGGSPLVAFLRERRGSCQLFATAMVVLLRARGVPARYVAGYYDDDPKIGKPILLREWDAHAWAEVLTTDGPVLIDATPPTERGGRQAHNQLWTTLLDFWETAQFQWLRSVVDYDSRRQASQARGLVKLFRSPTLPRMPVIPAPLLVLVVIALGAALASLRRPRDDVALRLERRLLVRLSRKGLRRLPGDTHEDVLNKLRATSVSLAATVSPLLHRVGAARFGARPIDKGEAAALRRRISRI